MSAVAGVWWSIGHTPHTAATHDSAPQDPSPAKKPRVTFLAPVVLRIVDAALDDLR